MADNFEPAVASRSQTRRLVVGGEVESAAEDRTRQMRRSVLANTSRRSRMTEEEQKVTCAICLDNISEADKTTLDCCQHEYCNECILQWATTVENTCPLCKRRITTLSTNDAEGNQVEQSVHQQQQQQPRQRNQRIILDVGELTDWFNQVRSLSLRL